MDMQIELFGDKQAGGFYFTSTKSDKLPVRRKEFYDGAIPAGNSVSAMNLLRLARMTGLTEYEKQATKIFTFGVNKTGEISQAYASLLTAFDFALGPGSEIIIVGDKNAADTRNMISAVCEKFLPHNVIIQNEPGQSLSSLGVNSHYTGIDGKATAYVCRGRKCELPTTEVSIMLGYLEPPNSK
jgi:uncharacterized protein YyaL (SSP411 family)